MTYTTEQFDIMITGLIFAYDAETGDVLHIDEVYEEVSPGKGEAMRRAPSQADCDIIREIAAADHPRRKIAVLAMAAETEIAPPSSGQFTFHVDPVTQKLRLKDMPCMDRLSA